MLSRLQMLKHSLELQSILTFPSTSRYEIQVIYMWCQRDMACFVIMPVSSIGPQQVQMWLFLKIKIFSFDYKQIWLNVISKTLIQWWMYNFHCLVLWSSLHTVVDKFWSSVYPYHIKWKHLHVMHQTNIWTKWFFVLK